MGSSVYCEPCLAAKIAAADAGSTSPGPGYGYGGAPAGGSYPYSGGTTPPQPPMSGVPNPGLAALLGFIPGVGAFYNGQYAKGIVHLVVFAILTTLADRSGIFGMFVAGWIFYQVIEAHHTARARRDGTPLPNPFGLNDIGERLGFGKAWPGPPAGGAAAPPRTGSAAAAEGSPYGAPASGYTPPASAYTPPASVSTPPAAGYAPGSVPPPQASWGAPADPYTGAPAWMPPPPPMVPAGRGVPTGAILLIGLGVLFLIGNSGLFHGFPMEKLIPFLLIGFGVWLFVRKMTETGGSLSDDGTPAYRFRVFRAARGPVWIVLVGVLFLLDTFGILSWGRSWPLFIIVGGLVTIFERTSYTATPIGPSYRYGTGAAPGAPPPTEAGSSSPSSATEIRAAEPREADKE